MTASAIVLLPSLVFEASKSAFQQGSRAWAKLSILPPEAAPAAAGAARSGFACAFSVDCSGSMSQAAGPGERGISLGSAESSKMERAKQALIDALDELGPDDMASLTAFSSQAVTLFPLAAMTEQNKALLRAQAQKLSASGGTALHDGWALAGKEAARGLDHGLVCRVILITDGEASSGERDPERLAKHAATLASLGVSSSCFGVGAQFNEDLLCAMSEAGEGNFRYIPDALLASAAMSDELAGLTSQVGRKTRLRLLPLAGCDSLAELNGLALDPNDGSITLANLISGRPIEILIEAQLAQGFEGQAQFEARLSWESRDGSIGSACALCSLTALPAGSSEPDFESPEVAGLRAALLAAKEKASMAVFLAQGDLAAAGASLERARGALAAAPSAYSGMLRESAALSSLETSFSSGDMAATRKSAVWQNYTSTKNQAVDDTPRS